jgi:hypothetical protein
MPNAAAAMTIASLDNAAKKEEPSPITPNERKFVLK